MALHPTACPLDCPDACGVLVETDDAGAFRRLRGNPDHPWSRGSLCSKTASYGDLLEDPNRILHPLVRNAAGELERATWDEALARIAERVRPCQPGDILSLSYAGNMGQVSAQYPKRLMHRLGATFADGGICDAAAEAGFEKVLGSAVGPPPGALDDADAVVVWGADPRRTMPHLFSKLKAVRDRGAPVWVIDVYRSDTVEAVERWGGRSLILRPGTDAALALGLTAFLFDQQQEDRDFLTERCEGEMSLRRALAGQWTPERVVRETGLDPEAFFAFHDDLVAAERPYLKVGIGFARRRNGGMSMRAVCTWAAVLGQADRVHFQTGAFFGPKYGDPAGEADRPLGVPMATIPHVALGHELERGDFPVIFVWGHNPAATVPDSIRVRRELARADRFLVVHELVRTETVQLADVVLPATAFPEHADLLRSYGHRVLQVGWRAVDPPGEARSNVATFQAIAKALGDDDPVWDRTEEEIVEGLVEAYAPILDEGDMERLLEGHPVVPAFPAHRLQGTLSGKIEFACPQERDAGGSGLATYEPDDGADGIGRYGLVAAPSIATHNSTYTHTSRHRARAAGARAHVHPDDAADLGVAEGDGLRLSNEQGALTLPATLDDRMPRGLVRVDGFPLEDEVPEGVGINALVPGVVSDLANGNSLYSTRVDLERA